MKKNKTLDRVLNIITIIIAIVVLIVAIITIVSAEKGYTAMFGKAGISVLSNSMEGEAKDSFKKGDLIYIDILKADEKTTLVVGDVVTFYDIINGVKALNTHRIIDVIDFEGQEKQYVTKGDNSEYMDSQSVAASEVVGKYNGTRLAGIGAFLTFMRGPVGFALFVVAPAFLVVIYALYKVLSNYKIVNKEKMELAREQGMQDATLSKEEMEQKIRQELLMEMQKEHGTPIDDSSLDDKTNSINPKE